MFRAYRKSGLPVVVRHTHIALNSALICPCARSIKIGAPVDLAILGYFAIDGRLAGTAGRSISGYGYELLRCWRLDFFRRSVAIVCPGNTSPPML
jgi:hypothetical protein